MKRIISFLLAITLLSSVLFVSPSYAATTLQTPRIYAPDDTVEIGSIEFDWSDVSGARYYIFALRDETTGVKVIDNKQISSSSYTLSSGYFKVGHTYKLAVGAYAADDNQAWTNPYYFEVVAPEMSAPYFTAPQNGETLSFANVTVRWNSVREASYYLFSLRDVTTNQLLLDNVKSYNAYYTISRSMLTKGHEYKVAVGAFDVYGNQKWDNPSYFKIETDQVAPAPVSVNNPTIIYPYNYSAVDYENIFALWTEEPLASHYIFSLRNSNTNQSIYNRSTTASNNFAIPMNMIEPGAQYKWAAAAVVNGVEYWTEVVYFTVNQQKLIAPVIGTSNLQSVKEGTDVFINWSSSAGANSYMISVLNVTDNVKVINNSTVYTNSYAIGKHLLKPNKQYKVAVGAMYSNGNEAWAEPVYFDVLYNPPAILDASVNNGIAGDLFDFKIKVNKYTTYVDLYDENNYFIERITTFSNYGDYKISQYKRYVQNAGNRSLKLYAGNDAVTLGNPTLLNFLVEKASTQVALFDITAPTSQLKHKMDSNLWVQWNAPATPKDVVYNLKMYHNNSMVYSKNGINATSLSIPMNFFSNAGSYSIDIYALKSGFEQAISSVTFDVVSPISSWAVKSVETLKAQNIIKTELVETWVDTPKVNMTRSDFAEILVSLYEHLIKTQTPYIRLDLSQAKNFTDIGSLSTTKQLAVKKANALGIVNGYANNTFDPNGPVTREQLATMLRNVYYAVNGYDLDMKNADWRQNFSDASSISSWAYESVRFVNALEILNGTGAKFEPKANATKEMGLVLADKAAGVLSRWIKASNYRIKSYDQITKMTPLEMEVTYNGMKLGSAKYSVNWSFANANGITASIKNSHELWASGTGSITVSGEYKGIKQSKIIKVTKPKITSNTFFSAASDLESLAFDLKSSQVLSNKSLTNVIQSLRSMENSKSEDNILHNLVGGVLNFGSYRKDEVKELLLAYAINASQGNVNISELTDEISNTLDAIPGISKIIKFSSEDYKHVIGILNSTEWDGVSSFVNLNSDQKKSLYNRLRGYFTFTEEAVGAKFNFDDQYLSILDSIKGSNGNAMSYSSLNEIYEVATLGEVVPNSYKATKFGTKILSFLNKASDYLDYSFITLDGIIEISSISAVNLEAIKTLEILESTLSKNNPDYSIIKAGIDDSIYALNNQYEVAVTKMGSRFLHKFLDASASGKNAYFEWFRFSQAFTNNLVGEWHKNNKLAQKYIQMTVAILPSVSNQANTFINMPTYENYEKLITVLDLFNRSAEAAINADVASEQGGVLYSVANGLFWGVNKVTLDHVWQNCLVREISKINHLKSLSDKMKTDLYYFN